MSQYLNFILKKDNETITAGWFCTTPARKISGIDAFPYEEDDKLLDENTFNTYLKFIKDERNEMNEHFQNALKRKEEITETLVKCASKEVAELLMEQLNNVKYSIKDWEEEIEEWDFIINKIKFIFELWKDNTEWSLYYNNC